MKSWTDFRKLLADYFGLYATLAEVHSPWKALAWGGLVCVALNAVVAPTLYFHFPVRPEGEWLRPMAILLMGSIGFVVAWALLRKQHLQRSKEVGLSPEGIKLEHWLFPWSLWESKTISRPFSKVYYHTLYVGILFVMNILITGIFFILISGSLILAGF